MVVSPFAGVGRIDADDGDATPGGHGGQPGAKLRGGDASHGGAQPFPAAATAQGFPPGGAGIGEIKVLRHNRRTALLGCGGCGQPVAQHRQPTRFGEPLGCAAIAPRPRRRRSPPPAWVSSVSVCSGAGSPGRSAHRCSSTPTALRRSVTWAVRPRMPSWYWSSTARVIAPAHRDDAPPVIARLRCARHAAQPFESSTPQPTRPASSDETPRPGMPQWRSKPPPQPRWGEFGSGSVQLTAPRPPADHRSGAT
ncbi:MAG: hypothetical protein QOI29_2524 [Mycobacterium sp.]|nr:hypothetical protein [Mycobacterium sp.]